VAAATTVPIVKPTKVVGIGASAGGLEAFSRLFGALPARTGLAYVLVPHLSPTHPSELTQLMARVAPFPVTQAREGEKLRPDHLYVLPPDRMLQIVDGHILLTPRPPRDGAPTVIDACFTSLAEAWGERAVGVVLSGNGSDGAAGLKAIKAHGGTTFAQDFISAAYDSMPRSAVLAGGVDFTLPPEGIAQALVHQLKSDAADLPVEPPPHLTPRDVVPGSESESEPELTPPDTGEFEAVLTLLQAGTGVDFHRYKRPSIVRRVRRRMDQVGMSELGAYREMLAQSPVELQALFNTVLIHVTEFFRDPETFEVLQSTVIPTLFANRTDAAPLRIWVVGCASGEEAYSIAMVFAEAEAALGREIPVRIFATDLSEPVLATARLGRYPVEIARDVSPERLARFFVPVEGGYQVQKRVRDMVVFARQDVTRDPPYAQIDLILCRNVLIYLDPTLQRRALNVFHYALNPAGFLTLGPAETVAGMEPLFSPVDRVRRVFLRRPTPARLPLDLGWSGQQRPLAPALFRSPGLPTVPWTDAELQQRAALALFAQGATGSVIVNGEMEIRHFQGQVSPYLEPPSGGPTVHLLRMAHPDLRLIVGRLIRNAQRTQQVARRRDLQIRAGGKVHRLTVRVLPFPTDQALGEHYLILFDTLSGERRPKAEGSEAAGTAASAPAADEPRSLQLEQELAETKEYLQAIIDQQDETHAELQAAYEASRSSNEEFQSTNEELESTKEELQAVNEELNTLNEQLQQRNAELTTRAAEVSGLLEAMEIPIFLLTADLRLHAFNAKAAAALGLGRSHVGHRTTELPWPLPTDDLRRLASEVLAGGGSQETEVQDAGGDWYVLRLWPVLPAPGNPSGVLGALIDIRHLRENLDHANQARAFSEAIVDSVRVPLLVLDKDFRVLTANRAFRDTFGPDVDPVEGRSVWEVSDGAWDRPDLRGLLDKVRQTGRGFEAHELEIESRRLGQRFLELTGRRVIEPGSGARHVLLAIEDLTGRRKMAQQIGSASRMQAVGQLAGGVAHEINNQMMAVLGFADLLVRSGRLDEQLHDDVAHITKAGRRAAEITRQLLAFGRRQSLRPVVAELNALVSAAEGLLAQIIGPEIELVLSLGDGVGQVRVDQAQLEQMLVNLVLNARDAMGPHGRLTIETTSVTVDQATDPSETRAQVPRGTYARLIVRDTGSGMDAATLDRIFEPFFTTKPQGLGTGLGLASVYGLVKQSGGFIWVESQPERGTTFTIDLPRAVASNPEKPPAEPAVEMTGGAETILVAEDHDAVRTWVCRSLSELGYTVLEARDGAEALRVMTEASGGVSLVLADVIMRGMGGAELRDRLAEEQPSMPVLLMSGHAPDELVGRRLVSGEEPLLEKPFDIAQMDRQIRHLLNARTGSAT
jgi:two-component system CheB/CheR fusion protein